MKKYGQQVRHKQQNHRHARRQFANKQVHKKWRRRRNVALIKMPKENRAAYFNDLKTHKVILQHERIVSPENLSILNYPEEVISFLIQLRACYNRKRAVNLDLTKLKSCDYDGILVLISIMTRFKANKIEFSVRNPKDPILKAKLTRAHLRECLTMQIKDVSKYIYGEADDVFTIADREFNPEVTFSMILSASQSIWGEQRRCPGVQTVFVELMHNTVAHALGENGEDIDISRRKHWWCTVDKTVQGRVAFSFVDYGVGVFKSLENKPVDSIWDGFKKIRNAIKYKSDADVFKDILNGVIHETVTGKDFRGKGLPGIYDNFERGIIKNLKIITNEVFFNSDNNTYVLMNNQFEGTFIYWEIDESTPSFT